jgi:hypothetical protein
VFRTSAYLLPGSASLSVQQVQDGHAANCLAGEVVGRRAIPYKALTKS